MSNPNLPRTRCSHFPTDCLLHSTYLWREEEEEDEHRLAFGGSAVSSVLERRVSQFLILCVRLGCCMCFVIFLASDPCAIFVCSASCDFVVKSLSANFEKKEERRSTCEVDVTFEN